MRFTTVDRADGRTEKKPDGPIADAVRRIDEIGAGPLEVSIAVLGWLVIFGSVVIGVLTIKVLNDADSSVWPGFAVAVGGTVQGVFILAVAHALKYLRAIAVVQVHGSD